MPSLARTAFPPPTRHVRSSAHEQEYVGHDCALQRGLAVSWSQAAARVPNTAFTSTVLLMWAKD